ncbi:MAG TPA: hypothetical protein VN626_03515 [Clostridia bacterium]|nr:hypothetical protein [Clostridia bacterium]
MLIVNGSDLTQIACNIKYTDQFNNGASSLTWDYPASKSGLFPEGSVVTFSHNGVNVFYGFLFISKAGPKTISCTAYDQMRYLKAQDFMNRKGETLDAFCKRLFAQFNERISVGQIDSTGAVLSDKIFDNKTYLDMIYQSISESLYLNGYYYALRDEFGALTLRDVYDLRQGLVIGDGSLATDYSYTRSIDSDTYNFVKVGQDNDATGQRDVYAAQDSPNITQWGKLMLYKTVSDQNEAQLKALAANILAVKNRATETLTVDCVGDLRVRAGVGLKVEISSVGVNLWAIVNRAVHSFNGAAHTMKLDLQYGRWQSWQTS